MDELVADRTPAALEADWNDIDASVAAAVSRVEMAILSTNERPTWGGAGGHQSRRVFHLKTIRDEVAWLVIERALAPNAEPADAGTPVTLHEHERMMTAMNLQRADAAGAPERLTLRARVGRQGDPHRERDLLRAVSERLEQLRGRAWAPLD